PICPFTPLGKGDLLMAKAWDNRAGCAVAVRLLHELKGTDHPNTVYAVGTVQEEVGLRGAQTMSERINPDVAFAVDVAIAGDTPGIKEHEARAKLGQGPVVLLYEASMVPHRGLRALVVDDAAPGRDRRGAVPPARGRHARPRLGTGHPLHPQPRLHPA